MGFYIICIEFREDQGRINARDIYLFRSCIYGDCIFVYIKVTWENDKKRRANPSTAVPLKTSTSSSSSGSQYVIVLEVTRYPSHTDRGRGNETSFSAMGHA